MTNGLAMIDSINGSFVTADLCLAVDNRLFLASVFTIQGQGPFRTLLFGTPLDGDCAAVDANEHQNRFPHAGLVLSPHVDVAVSAACDDLIGPRAPVDSGYLSGMFAKFGRFRPFAAPL